MAKRLMALAILILLSACSPTLEVTRPLDRMPVVYRYHFQQMARDYYGYQIAAGFEHETAVQRTNRMIGRVLLNVSEDQLASIRAMYYRLETR